MAKTTSHNVTKNGIEYSLIIDSEKGKWYTYEYKIVKINSSFVSSKKLTDEEIESYYQSRLTTTKIDKETKREMRQNPTYSKGGTMEKSKYSFNYKGYIVKVEKKDTGYFSVWVTLFVKGEKMPKWGTSMQVNTTKEQIIEAVDLYLKRYAKMNNEDELLSAFNNKFAEGGNIGDYELKIQPSYKYQNIAKKWLEDNDKSQLIYKLAILILREQKDPDEILNIKEDVYPRLLRRLDKIGESKHEGQWRTENYTIGEAEKWAYDSLSEIFYLYKDTTHEYSKEWFENSFAKGGSLDKLWRFSDEGVKSFRQMIDEKKFDGKYKTIENALEFNRIKWNRMYGAEQNEWVKKANKKVIKYNLQYKDKTTNTVVTKEIYDYANLPELPTKDYYREHEPVTGYIFAKGGNINNDFKNEFVLWLKKHSVDVNQLKFVLKSKSPYQKHRYETDDVDSEIWVYNLNGSKYGVVTKQDFEHYKSNQEYANAMIYGHNYPMTKFAKGGSIPKPKFEIRDIVYYSSSDKYIAKVLGRKYDKEYKNWDYTLRDCNENGEWLGEFPYGLHADRTPEYSLRLLTSHDKYCCGGTFAKGGKIGSGFNYEIGGL